MPSIGRKIVVLARLSSASARAALELWTLNLAALSCSPGYGIFRMKKIQILLEKLACCSYNAKFLL